MPDTPVPTTTRWAPELERDKLIIFGVTVAVLACGLGVFALIMWWVRS